MKNKKTAVVFAITLASGIALCVAGLWVPPLLIPGGVCLAGAFGMYASSFVRMYPEEPQPNVENVNTPTVPNVNIILDHSAVVFTPMFDVIERPRRPSLEMMEERLQGDRLTLV